MLKNYISDGNSIIQIVCENKILQILKEEFGDYYKFEYGETNADFDFFIYIDKLKYEKALRNFENIRNLRENICIQDREGILLLNKVKKEVVAIYYQLTDNNIQLIGELIISLFGIKLEQNGYFYLHSACVEKNGKGIAIIGARGTGKTTLLNILLQNQFNFVCNSHLGIKNANNDIIANGTPSRIGIRVETLYKAINPIVRERIIEYSEIKKRFGENIEENINEYGKKKFNIKMNEIKKIYNVDIKKETNVKMFLVPVYMPGSKHIKIKKIREEETLDILLKNKRKGVYNTIKYLDNVFFTTTNNIKCNLKNINMYKIYQNEGNTNELIEFVNKNINE